MGGHYQPGVQATAQQSRIGGSVQQQHRYQAQLAAASGSHPDLTWVVRPTFCTVLNI